MTGETIAYQYDSLNRLISAAGSGWGDAYGFDGFGNLLSKTVTAGSAPTLSTAVNSANNQIVGLGYDANGNQATPPNNSGELGYDSENRLIENGVSVQYAYDSENKRVWAGTLVSGGLTSQSANLYGIDGQMLGSYSLSMSSAGITDIATSLSVYFAGRRVGTVSGGGTMAFVQDRLGSNMSWPTHFDFISLYPWGEDRGTPAPNDQIKFATYTRDSATLLDYADQRYYSNQYGRFVTPDPSTSSQDPKTPQSWNRYPYVLGDPVNGNDPSGLLLEGPCDPIFGCDDGGGGGGGNGGNPCVGADGFTPSPSPFCQGGGPPQPALPGPDPLDCDVMLLSQPAGPKSDPFDHTLLKVTFSNGKTNYLEGVPIPKNPKSSNVVTDPMWLNASDIKTGTSYYGNPTTLIQSWLEVDSFCDSLVSLVDGYTDNATTYNNTWFWSGPNSNSFTHSLLNIFGLSVEGGLSNFWYPGWSNTSVSFF